jgi:hypothetical protein
VFAERISNPRCDDASRSAHFVGMLNLLLWNQNKKNGKTNDTTSA